MNVVLQLLAVYGVTFAARSASLLDVPRDWLLRKIPMLRALLECAFCTGFHAGWIVFVVGTIPSGWTLRGFLLAAFSGAAFAYMLDAAILAVEAATQRLQARVLIVPPAPPPSSPPKQP